MTYSPSTVGLPRPVTPHDVEDYRYLLQHELTTAIAMLRLKLLQSPGIFEQIQKYPSVTMAKFRLNHENEINLLKDSIHAYTEALQALEQEFGGGAIA